jgi:hypothetical protein
MRLPLICLRPLMMRRPRAWLALVIIAPAFAVAALAATLSWWLAAPAFAAAIVAMWFVNFHLFV